MSATIFISHASKDKKVALTLCNALEARGQRCWIAHRDVGPGSNFQEEIVRALRGMKLMILVFTSNANNSNEIKKELALASQFGVFVIPIRVEDVVPSEAFAYELATRQWVDMFDDWETAISSLVDRIGTITTAKLASAHAGRKTEVNSRPHTASTPVEADDREKRAKVLLMEGKAAEERGSNQSAIRFYRGAADRGSAEAMYRLGRMLEATGKPADRPEAVTWYKRAAELGHTDAQYCFCLYQYAGEGGVPKDMTGARAHMEKLAANGHAKAKEWLARS